MRHLSIAVVLGLSLAACTYRGGDMGDPLTRKLHWFSYVAGDDIHANCQPGTPDRYRLVYNAVYGEHLRLYEVDSLRRVLSAKVSEPGDAKRLDADDLLAPWRAVEAKTQLDQAGYDQLVGAFAAAGLFGPPAVGLELPSRGFHWTAAACKDGHFHFTGWKYPDAAFTRLTFPTLLFAADGTGVAVRPAGPIALDPQYEANLREGKVTSFTLKVGADGLVR